MRKVSAKVLTTAELILTAKDWVETMVKQILTAKGLAQMMETLILTARDWAEKMVKQMLMATNWAGSLGWSMKKV